MKQKGWFGLAIVACAACCAAPFWLLSAAGVAGIAALSADTWICGLLILLAVGIWYWRYRQRRSQSCGATSTWHCAMDCDCKPD